MGLRLAVPSSLPPSAHSSCQMATWPTWASWRQAPTPTPPQDLRELRWPRAAMLWLPLWTSSASRASCFAPEAPARWTVRVQGHLPPPWPEARPEASASSWTVKSERTVAGPGLLIGTHGASVTVWRLGPRPAALVLASHPVWLLLLSITSICWGNPAPRVRRREWARAHQLFQCVNPRK